MIRSSPYDRVLVGFHGTSRTRADEIVRTQSFRPSRNNHDWLGHGVYFWEHAPRQALWWAQKRYNNDASVVASLLRLENCLDLLDPENARELQRFHDDLVASLGELGERLPDNHNVKKYRDCAVLEAYYRRVRAQGFVPIQSARGVYVPTPGATGLDGGGVRLWPRSWLTLDAHIQVCIRPDAVARCIVGTWPVDIATITT